MTWSRAMLDHALRGALSADAIRRLLDRDPPLIGGLRDPARQVQPNGVDLTLDTVWRMDEPGVIGVEDDERVIPERLPVEDRDGAYDLAPAAYVVRLHEVVALPRDVMAFGRPRSSLLRCGVAIHTAVWDAGYAGRSEALLVVYHPAGFRVRRGSRVLQLVFVALDAPTTPYAGRYQGEHL
jgi:dUTP pyrophosphatase